MREAQLCLPEAYRAPVSLYILSLSGMLMLSCCKIYKSTKDNTYHEHCLYCLYLSLCESVCRVYMHVFIAQYTCDHFPSGWNQRSCQLCLNSQRWHQTCLCISLTFSHASPLPFFYPPSSWLRITGRGGWMWCCCFFLCCFVLFMQISWWKSCNDHKMEPYHRTNGYDPAVLFCSDQNQNVFYNQVCFHIRGICCGLCVMKI